MCGAQDCEEIGAFLMPPPKKRMPFHPLKNPQGLLRVVVHRRFVKLAAFRAPVTNFLHFTREFLVCVCLLRDGFLSVVVCWSLLVVL